MSTCMRCSGRLHVSCTSGDGLRQLERTLPFGVTSSSRERSAGKVSSTLMKGTWDLALLLLSSAHVRSQPEGYTALSRPPTLHQPLPGTPSPHFSPLRCTVPTPWEVGSAAELAAVVRALPRDQGVALSMVLEPRWLCSLFSARGQVSDGSAGLQVDRGVVREPALTSLHMPAG